MKKAHAYLIGGTMIGLTLIFSESCTKSTPDDELIGNWKKAPDDYEGDARTEAVSFTIGDFVYVGTGNTVSPSKRFNDFWKYSLDLRYWTQVKALEGVARNSAVAFSINDKGYVGTGYDGSAYLNDFWEYDPAANDWIARDPFPGTARLDAVGFAVNGKGYIGCGFDGNYLKDFWQYDPAAPAGSRWSQKASVGGSKRRAAMSFVLNNKAYILSGNNNGVMQTDMWVYDDAANTWTEKTKIYNYSDDSYDDDYGTIARQNGVTFIMNNLAYLTCGENGSLNSTTWQYDPATDRWLEKTAFEGTARTGAIAFALKNRGIVLTGISGSLVMDNGYEFLPNDEQVDND